MSKRTSRPPKKIVVIGEARTARIIAAVKTVSDDVGRSMAQIALAWLRHRPVPVAAIFGARKLSQLLDNLVTFDLTLSAHQLQKLDAAGRIELGFPHELYPTPRAITYGRLRDHISN